MNFADKYYLDSHGEPTREPESIRYALGVLLERFPSMPVEEFGSLRLKEVREAMIDKNLCRNLINKHTGRIKRMFK
ncbi:MAG: hypothetical protein J7K65_06645 [Planctomycetes bacterium]|nr:hypothetical protein [Planctomycetota bacterium]